MTNRTIVLLLSAVMLAGCYALAAADDRSAGTESALQQADDQSQADLQPEEESDPEYQQPDQQADQQADGRADDEEIDDPAELPPDQQPPPPDRGYDISEVYATACVDCHGERGDGDGAVEEGFSFDTPADEWTNGPTVDGILVTLEDGIHDSAMQRFPQFTNEDRVELAEYVIDLRHALEEVE